MSKVVRTVLVAAAAATLSAAIVPGGDAVRGATSSSTHASVLQAVSRPHNPVWDDALSATR